MPSWKKATRLDWVELFQGGLHADLIHQCRLGWPQLAPLCSDKQLDT